MSPAFLVPRSTFHVARFIKLLEPANLRPAGSWTPVQSWGTRFVGRGYDFSFHFTTHASFHVPRWAFDLALNIKRIRSGIPAARIRLHF